MGRFRFVPAVANHRWIDSGNYNRISLTKARAYTYYVAHLFSSYKQTDRPTDMLYLLVKTAPGRVVWGARTISGGRLSDRGRSCDCGRIVNCLPERPVQIYAGRTLGSCSVAHLSVCVCCTLLYCSVMMTHLKRREPVWTLVNRLPAVSRPISSTLDTDLMREIHQAYRAPSDTVDVQFNDLDASPAGTLRRWRVAIRLGASVRTERITLNGVRRMRLGCDVIHQGIRWSDQKPDASSVCLKWPPDGRRRDRILVRPSLIRSHQRCAPRRCACARCIPAHVL
ncbi:hypothetical protein CBL_06516 [Carabus blaptoides fortunei]